MLKIEKFATASPEQWEIIIEGMRNPMNSWGKMDSGVGCDEQLDYPTAPYHKRGLCKYCAMPVEAKCYRSNDNEFILGPNDHTLMMSLAEGGPVHAKYRRMIPVYVTLTAPLYW